MKLDSTPRRTFKVQVLLIKGSSEDPSSPYKPSAQTLNFNMKSFLQRFTGVDCTMRPTHHISRTIETLVSKNISNLDF